MTGKNEKTKIDTMTLKVLAAALTTALLLGMTLLPAPTLGGQIFYRLVVTKAAQARTAAGECAATPATPTCAEVCAFTTEGDMTPMDKYMCTNL